MKLLTATSVDYPQVPVSWFLERDAGVVVFLNLCLYVPSAISLHRIREYTDDISETRPLAQKHSFIWGWTFPFKMTNETWLQLDFLCLTWTDLRSSRSLPKDKFLNRSDGSQWGFANKRNMLWLAENQSSGLDLTWNLPDLTRDFIAKTYFSNLW